MVVSILGLYAIVTDLGSGCDENLVQNFLKVRYVNQDNYGSAPFVHYFNHII